MSQRQHKKIRATIAALNNYIDKGANEVAEKALVARVDNLIQTFVTMQLGGKLADGPAPNYSEYTDGFAANNPPHPDIPKTPKKRFNFSWTTEYHDQMRMRVNQSEGTISFVSDSSHLADLQMNPKLAGRDLTSLTKEDMDLVIEDHIKPAVNKKLQEILNLSME